MYKHKFTSITWTETESVVFRSKYVCLLEVTRPKRIYGVVPKQELQSRDQRSWSNKWLKYKNKMLWKCVDGRGSWKATRYNTCHFTNPHITWTLSPVRLSTVCLNCVKRILNNVAKNGHNKTWTLGSKVLLRTRGFFFKLYKNKFVLIVIVLWRSHFSEFQEWLSIQYWLQIHVVLVLLVSSYNFIISISENMIILLLRALPKNGYWNLQ